MKTIFYTLSAFLLWSVSAPAGTPLADPVSQTVPYMAHNLNARELQNLFDKHKSYFRSVDYMLDRLLAIPEEKRQYFFPMLHEYRVLPHKITSHPQIIIWKGKKPTVIAPQLQEWAKKHLEALPASLYPYLDPEMWRSPLEKQAYYKSLISLSDIPLLSDEPKAPNPGYKVKSLEEIYHVPAVFSESYTQSTLTESDISRTVDTLNELPAFIDGIDSHLGSRLRDYLGENLAFVMAWPFREWTFHVEDTQNGEKLDSYLKSKGWENRDEFIEKADRILKSYRVSQMTLPEAIAISGFRKEYPVKENEKFLPIQMLAEFYHAKGGDALFVEQFAPRLKETFKNKHLMRVGLPIELAK